MAARSEPCVTRATPSLSALTLSAAVPFPAVDGRWLCRNSHGDTSRHCHYQSQLPGDTSLSRPPQRRTTYGVTGFGWRHTSHGPLPWHSHFPVSRLRRPRGDTSIHHMTDLITASNANHVSCWGEYKKIGPIHRRRFVRLRTDLA